MIIAIHKRRILISTSTFPLGPDDGIPRFVLDLARSMVAHYEVSVLAPAHPGTAGEVDIEGVRVRRYRYFVPEKWQMLAYRAGMPDNIKRSAMAKLQIPFLLVAQRRALAKWIREEGIELVNSHWLVPQGLCYASLRHRVGVPHVMSVHSSDVNLLRQKRWGSPIARYAMKRSDAGIVAGSQVRTRLDALLGFQSNCDIRSMGADVRRFCAAPGKPPSGEATTVLFVGRFVEIKGVDILLDAFSGLTRWNPDVHLNLVGYGPRRPQVERQIRELDLSRNVSILGRKSHAQIVELIRACSVFVVPSIVEKSGRTEGLPTVIVEALACGAVVLASDVGSVRDLLEDGVNGYLVQPGSAGELRRKLRELLESDHAAVSKNAVSTAQDHDWDRVAERYADVFDRVIARQ